MENSEPHEDLRLLTVAELCELWHISRPGVFRLIRAGELPAIKIGARVRFTHADVAALIARGRSPQSPRESNHATV